MLNTCPTAIHTVMKDTISRINEDAMKRIIFYLVIVGQVVQAITLSYADWIMART